MAAILSAIAFGEHAAAPVSDENLRVVALKTVFPGGQISMDRGTKIERVKPTRFNSGAYVPADGLAGEKVYRVVGKAMNDSERVASEDVATLRVSETRQVRFMVFRWPYEDIAGLLVVLQYDFQGVHPALCCLSIGLLAHLVKDRVGNWTLADQFPFETAHHSRLGRIELLNLGGDGTNDLVIESNFGGPGTGGTRLHIFALSHGRFEEILRTNSDLAYMDEEGYSQVLDIALTRSNHGRQFCFIKATRFESGKWFDHPRISHPCYERGEGVDPQPVR
jgi:hypothetical protein